MLAYITAAPPLTAIHYFKSEGISNSDKIALEMLFEQRKLNWRYGAVHFEGGSDIPYPQRPQYPGADLPDENAGITWENATIDDLVSPEVLALLEGG